MKGWKTFEKIGKKGLKTVYDFVQKRKTKSFSEFEKIVQEDKKRQTEDKLFFAGKYDIAEMQGIDDESNKPDRKKDTGKKS